MSAIKIPIPLVTDDAIAAKWISDNSYLLDRRTSYTNGSLVKGIMGSAGDSMAGYGTGPQSAEFGDALFYGSPLNMLLMYRYCADFIIDTRPYYQTEVAGEPRMPVGQRGHGFAKGGTSVQHFVDTQIPYILESPPEFLFLSIFQNGGYFFQDGKQRFETDIALAKANIPRLLDAGITILQAGVYPHSNVGGGSHGSQYKHRVEQEMLDFAARTPGLTYFPWLDRLKDFNPAQEQSGQVNWRPGADVGDGLHSGTLGGWIQSEVMEPDVRRMFAEYKPPVFDLADYNELVNPFGNVLGAAGSMTGTGGLLNGNASNDVPAGIEITYDTTKGVIITPSIVTRNGRPVLRLAKTAGTPTGDVQLRIAFPITKAFSEAPMTFYAEGVWDNAIGWGGLAVGGGFPIRNGVGSIGGGCILPFPLNRRWKARAGRPRNVRNNAGNRIELGIDTMFINGVESGGALEIERFGLFRTINDAPMS